MSVERLAVQIAAGALAGVLGGLLLRPRRFGLGWSLASGVVGAFVGPWLAGLIGFRPVNALGLFLAALGAAVGLLWLGSRLASGRRS